MLICPSQKRFHLTSETCDTSIAASTFGIKQEYFHVVHLLAGERIPDSLDEYDIAMVLGRFRAFCK